MVHLGGMHVFPVALVDREIRTLYSWAPDSVYRSPVLLDAPLTVPDGQAVTVKATLPLDWSIFPVGAPTTLRVELDDCGQGAVSVPSVLFTGGSQVLTFEVRMPAGARSVTVRYKLTGGDTARYSAPAPSVFVRADAKEVWKVAAFATNFPSGAVAASSRPALPARPRHGPTARAAALALRGQPTDVGVPAQLASRRRRLASVRGA